MANKITPEYVDLLLNQTNNTIGIKLIMEHDVPVAQCTRSKCGSGQQPVGFTSPSPKVLRFLNIMSETLNREVSYLSTHQVRPRNIKRFCNAVTNFVEQIICTEVKDHKHH